MKIATTITILSSCIIKWFHGEYFAIFGLREVDAEYFAIFGLREVDAEYFAIFRLLGKKWQSPQPSKYFF